MRGAHACAGREAVQALEGFLEPSGIGYATYAIGHSSLFDDMHTFKVERILDARLTIGAFEAPDRSGGAELPLDAWGVMSEPPGEETEVVLRFGPEVTQRVKEGVRALITRARRMRGRRRSAGVGGPCVGDEGLCARVEA